MTALAPHRDAPIRRRDRAPWSPRAWRQALYLTGAIPALVIVPLLVVAGLAIRPRWVLPLLFLVVALLAMPLLGQLHRHRLRATAGVAIPPQAIMPNGLSVAGIREAIRSPITWRQVGYHFLVAPALAVGGGRRLHDVAGGPAVRAGVHLRVDAFARRPCSPAASRKGRPGTSRR